MDNELDAIERSGKLFGEFCNKFYANIYGDKMDKERIKEYVLVKFCRDWADEFDVMGFAVFDKDEWFLDIEALTAAETLNDWYFGTNEGWDGEDINGRDFARSYSAVIITAEHYEALHNLFGDRDNCISWGHFPWPQDLIAHAEVVDGDREMAELDMPGGF